MKVNWRNVFSHWLNNMSSLHFCKGETKSSHYKFAGGKKPQNNKTHRKALQAPWPHPHRIFFLQQIRIIYSSASLRLSCILLTPQSFSSHSSYGATLDQFRGMRLPPGGGRLWPGILPPQPATPDGKSARYRKSAKCLNEVSTCFKNWDSLQL